MQVTFNKTHSHIDNNGVSHTFTTKVTKEGIRCISDGEDQGTYEPTYMPTFITSLEWCVEQKVIRSFTLGEEITVTDRNGYWEEIPTDSDE